MAGGTQQLRVHVAAYDRSHPLLIDPVLSYSPYLGGSDDDGGFGIAVDGAGNAYVTGRTESANVPTTSGAVQPTLRGDWNVFVSKLNATGTALVYSTYLGGSGSSLFDSSGDEAWGIAVDGAGNAYVTGMTESANFPTTPGAFQPTPPGGSSNAFVSKLNATGTAFVYSTYLGGSGDDSGYGIAVDGTGNAYVTGGTTSADFPTTPGAVQPTLQDSYGDAFGSKFNATGTVLGYSTYLGGEHSDEGQGIAVDGTGTAYVTGLTYSTDFPTTPGAVQPTLGGRYHSDAFVTKLVLGLPSAPTLALTVNTPSVHKGDTLTLSALATPGPTSATADVYIVLQPPGCASFTCLLFWQGGLTFTATPQPLLRNWPISPFNGPIFRYTFDGTALAGPYVWVGPSRCPAHRPS